MTRIASNAGAPWRAGLAGARANLVPGLVLQAAALALVIAYYRHAGAHQLLQNLTAIRAEWGAAFAIFSTGLFGGVIPGLYLKARRATRQRYTWGQLAGFTGFWAYKGFEIDLMYRGLAWLVGEKSDVPTIAIKAMLDQFVYSPIIAVPVTALFYHWVDVHFNGGAVAADVRPVGWYRRRVVPILISNLGVWVPAVCIIYALPTPLQLPLQNLVLCFFTLLLAHATRER